MSRLHRKIVAISSAVLLLWAVAIPAQQAPALKTPIGEIAGSFVLVGDGSIPDTVMAEFIKLAGGKNARFVLIPTASDTADGAEAGKSLEGLKREFELTSVSLLHTRKREEADSPDFVKPLTEARGVWFSGGDPAKLTAAYRGTLVEKELHKLLARGGVIGSSSACVRGMGPVMITGDDARVKVAPGFGFLPGALVDHNFPERNREARLTGVLANHPGYFGIGLDDSTAVIIKGRQMKVMGSAEALVYQSAGGGKPASRKSLKAGQEADLIALSRSAVGRTQPPFPPAKPESPRVAKGALMIGGGGGLSPDIWKRFIELAGGPDSLILVVPTANPDPLPAEPSEMKSLRANGAKNVKLLHTRSRAEADTPEFAAKVNEARGVWFSGGRQWRFVDSYEGTRTEKAFHEMLARGGVIGGSSAGASIQSEYMPRGDPLGNLNIIAEGYERGFGFLKGVAVDQHFFARKRTKDMTELMAAYPQLLGIGIDEGTVIIIQEATMEVAGKSKVAVYDRRKPVKPGENDYEELPAGAKYELEKRQRIEKP